MKTYQERTYRQHFDNERWRGFVCQYKDTDVWIGVDKASYHKNMPDFTTKFITALWDIMNDYLLQDPVFAATLKPHIRIGTMPYMAVKMSEASHQAGVGPMAAVAGAFAAALGQTVKQQFDAKEIIVENGGDIYVDLVEDIDVAVFAGESPLSEKIGLHIDAKKSPLGICTSSGTVGHSLSFGKADAVMIICNDALLADAYATAFANQIQTADDIDRLTETIGRTSNILGALLVKDDKMGIVGEFEMKLFH
ncbi:MAG: UPF0280 family protein [Bacteroidales bacterium]|jgi:ApbE superfamily uncharacterized protein (UPF0280 family)|nr:UPF0280 family protein [Bacteroidales bacterium]